MVGVTSKQPIQGQVARLRHAFGAVQQGKRCTSHVCCVSKRQLLTGTALLSALPPVFGHAASADEATAKPWVQQDERRMLHAVMVIADLDRQQEFYADVLGMRTLRYRSFDDGSANGFSGYLPEEAGFSLELAQRSKPPKIELGTGFRHYSVAVTDVNNVVELAKARGLETYDGSGVDGGGKFVRDPSGYPWQLSQRADGVPEPFREISLLVSNLEQSVTFYTDALGMRVVGRTQDDTAARRAPPSRLSVQARLCWGDPEGNTVFELTQALAGPLAGKAIDRGSEGYIQLAASTQDVYKTAEDVRSKGGAIKREPAPIAGVGGTKVTKVADPDGWVVAFVDNDDFLQELCKAGKLQSSKCKSSD